MSKKLKPGALLVIVIAIAIAASGCATAVPGRADRAAGLAVRGDLVNMSNVKIFVNGDKVIDDEVSLLHGNGRFVGTYGGKPVAANCSTESGNRRGTMCLVSIDNVLVARLDL